ncbi:hypothetical protein [Nocardioides sp. CER19]|uniref:hypothetical protein n=1 Tax=Nocardioides sp. CER19 TaxID=3038538 RepID=UPI00244AC518|nr:hypothetical protein [Nocardioides sp. CER19]MDH2415994.1 hypothetical protein [Nocardioides sp. CER19]
MSGDEEILQIGRPEPEGSERSLVRRHRTRLGAGVAAVALALGALAWTTVGPRTQHEEPPGPVPRPAAVVRLEAGALPHLAVPVTFPASSVLVRVEPGAGGEVARFNQVQDLAGVTILENVVPVVDEAGRRDPTAGRTARPMARWLAHRPYLVDTHVDPVTVGDLRGWRVTSDLVPRLKRSDDIPFVPGELPLRMPPVLRAGTAFARFGPAVGDMTFVDVPGAGVVAIWTWSARGDLRAATGPELRAFVGALRFDVSGHGLGAGCSGDRGHRAEERA